MMSFRRALSLVVLVVVLLLVEMKTVMGLHEMIQKHQTSSYDILLSSFSSGPSGNLSLKLQADLDPTYNRNLDPDLLWFTVVLLNNDQRDRFVSTETCYPMADFREEFHNSTEIQVKDLPQDMYWVYVINCQMAVINIAADAQWFAGPDGQQISLWEEPIFPFCCLLLVILIIGSLITTVQYSMNWRLLRFLHVLLAVVAICEILYLSSLIIYYDRYEETGEKSSFFSSLVSVSKVLSDSVMMACVMLVGVGWNILRSRLRVRDKQLLWGTLLLYVGFTIAYTMCGSPYNLCSIYWLFLLVIKVLMALAIIVTINNNCDELKMDFDDDPNGYSSIAVSKLQFYGVARVAILYYMIFPLAFAIFQIAFLSWGSGWMAIVFEQANLIAILMLFSYFLRPSRTGSSALYIRRSRRRRVPGGDDPAAPAPPPPRDEEAFHRHNVVL